MQDRVSCRFVTRPGPAALKAIITIYRAHGWWNTSDRPALLARIIRGSHCFAVAERGGRIVGMARAISDRASDAYIQDVAVLPEERGRGTGGRLVAAVVKRLKRDGLGWVALIAQDGSAPFYGRLGFKTLKKAAPMLAKGTHV